MPANIFVLGLDELNLESLRALPRSGRYRFHRLLSVDELIKPRRVDLPRLLEKAQRRLESFEGTIDAIMGYWDFPVSSMVPILCQRFGLPSAPLEAVVRCEHKYWSRLEQRKVTGAHPRFALVDLDGPPRRPPDVGFPMWVKPVKSASSEMAYQVRNATELARAVRDIRYRIARFGDAFADVLSMVDLPPEIESVGSRACLAEQSVGGKQVTVEGYVRHGQVHVYGIVDSITYDGTSSFLCYRYPSQLPQHLADRLVDISERVIKQIRLDTSTFNIEYFCRPDTGEINILEINPRLSQSHARLFEAVDGVANLECTVRLALGHEPELPYRDGKHRIAAKWFLRRFSDGVVRRVPTAAEIARIEQEHPNVTIALVPAEGDRLSDIPGQDSYSYELADLFIGAADEQSLTELYEHCARQLHFEIQEE